MQILPSRDAWCARMAAALAGLRQCKILVWRLVTIDGIVYNSINTVKRESEPSGKDSRATRFWATTIGYSGLTSK
jgi:hypothetical protein